MLYDILYHDSFTLQNVLLAYPFPAFTCSWLIFIIELSHCLDSFFFRYLRCCALGLCFRMIFTHPVQHFPPELRLPFSVTFTGCLAAWDSIPITTFKWSASRGVVLSLCHGLALAQHLTKRFFLIIVVMRNGFVWTHAVRCVCCGF